MTARLTNAPADPAVLFAEEVDDLMVEARNYLDGEPIANEQQAEAVSSLLNRARRVAKGADEARGGEKKPHDDAAKAVQAKWKPIIGKADLAVLTAKEALAPWLRKVEDEQRRAAELARQEADRLAAVAQAARLETVGDILAKQDAERLTAIAQDAQKHAAKADKAKPLAKGGERAIGLVDVFTPVLADAASALAHYRTAQPDALKAWLTEQAFKDVRSGARSIPGFEIKHERVAR